MSELAGIADIAVARGRRAAAHAAPLGRIPLFRGLGEDDLADLASAFESVELAPGEVLWRQATASDGLYVLIEGAVQVCRRLPGERELELARLGAGEVLGELPLLGGGTRTATVRALEGCLLLFLSRGEFEARSMSRQRGAVVLRRRIVAIACARLRRRLAAVAGALDGAAKERPCGPVEPVQPEPAAAVAPPSHVARLALFERLEADLVAELLNRGTLLAPARGQVVQRLGSQPEACYVTLNGAVEDVLRRGDPRVGFAGPGRAFGYVGLLDGEPAPATSVARERSLVLAIGAADFARLMHVPDARSRAFAAALEADLIRTLDVAERARARLAARQPQ